MSLTKDLPEWRRTLGYPVEYLRIGNKVKVDGPIIEMEKGLMQERAEFWHKLKAHAPASGSREEL